MKINEIMTANPKSHSREDNIAEVAASMRDGNVGAVPIVENEKIVGIVTDRDLAIRAVAEGRNLGTTTVQEIMTTEPVTVTEDTPLNEVAGLMKQHEIRRIIVTDNTGRASGIVSLGDLAAHKECTSEAEEVVHSGACAATS
jgi:CBS domain-containing protein